MEYRYPVVDAKRRRESDRRFLMRGAKVEAIKGFATTVLNRLRDQKTLGSKRTYGRPWANVDFGRAGAKTL